MHFSCGFEVDTFDCSDNSVKVKLKNGYKKKGSIFLYIPESKGLDISVVVKVNDNKPGNYDTVAKPSMGDNRAGRVLRAYIEIEGSGAKNDGLVSINW